jgi:hypothetical protein
MKSKALIFLSTVVMALGLMAQNSTQTTPAPTGDSAKTCACCNHDQAGSKMACCGKDAGCCKDGACTQGKGGACCQGKDGKQCPMMSKDKDGKTTCCADGKCPMMSKDKGTSCCGGKMCQRPQTGA